MVLIVFWIFFLSIFILTIFSGCFDTSGSLIRLSVSEILECDAFCDVQQCSAGGIGYFSSWILDAPSSIMLIYLLNFSKAFLSGFRKPPKRQKLPGKVGQFEWPSIYFDIYYSVVSECNFRFSDFLRTCWQRWQQEDC